MEIAKKRWDTDLETFKRYAEANPFYRIVVITDEDVMRICEKLKDKITKKRAERDLKIYDLPDDLVCPACSVDKEVFEKVE